VRNCLSRIEGEFSAFTVVDHRTISLSILNSQTMDLQDRSGSNTILYS
jgi:hypothetical protein